MLDLAHGKTVSTFFDVIGMDGKLCFNFHYVSSVLFSIIFLMCISKNMVYAAEDFHAYAGQRFELNGIIYGAEQHSFDAEVKSIALSSMTILGNLTKSLEKINILQKVLLVRLDEDFVTNSILTKLFQREIAAIIFIIPKRSMAFSQRLYSIENMFLRSNHKIPILTLFEDSNNIMDIFSKHQLNIHLNGNKQSLYQLIGNAIQNTDMLQFKATPQIASGKKKTTNIHMRNLWARQSADYIVQSLPTILIVTSYDSNGLFPTISVGADSTASSIASSMELARILWKYFKNPKFAPTFNVVFLYSAAGKLNYIGTDKWLEAQTPKISDLMRKPALIICLDAIGKGDKMYAHIPKQYSNDKLGYRFIQYLKEEYDDENSEESIEVIKKVRISEIMWEHEQFIKHKFMAMTLSHFSTASESISHRATITDTLEKIEKKNHAKHTQKILRSLLKIMTKQNWENDIDQLFSEAKVDEDNLSQLMEMLTAESREQLKFVDVNNQNQKLDGILSIIENYLSKYSHETNKQKFIVNDVSYYDGGNYHISVYQKKSAVFDLLCGICILGLLGIIYLYLTKINDRLIDHLSSFYHEKTH
ncbi:hypothetical protein SNEBB_008132 [Seison nebaliae]|nr:hypothetical protein SNEBB_008132 [Seison nebaliae]